MGYLLAVEGMRRRDGAWRPLAAGALLGLAFLAKYTAVLLVPATLVYFACSRPARRWLRRPSFYAGGAVALVLALPVIGWNMARGWPSLQLHLVDRASAGFPVAGENRINQLVAVSSSSGTGVLESVLRLGVGQLMAYSRCSPLLVVGIVRAVRRARGDDRYLLLCAFGLTVLVPLLAAMARLHDAEQHWTMVAFVPAVIGAAQFLDEAWDRAKVARAAAVGGVAVSALLLVLGNVHARSTALLGLWPSDHYDPKADVINELVGWDQVRASVLQAANAVPGRVVLAGSQYALCGRMLFEMADAPSVYCPTAKRSAYDFFDRRDPPSNATVIALTNEVHDEMPAGLEDRTCNLVDEVDIERGGRHVARYFVHACAPAPDLEDRASRE